MCIYTINLDSRFNLEIAPDSEKQLIFHHFARCSFMFSLLLQVRGYH